MDNNRVVVLEQLLKACREAAAVTIDVVSRRRLLKLIAELEVMQRSSRQNPLDSRWWELIARKRYMEKRNFNLMPPPYAVAGLRLLVDARGHHGSDLSASL